jgi:signal transduction histidine kinase
MPEPFYSASRSKKLIGVVVTYFLVGKLSELFAIPSGYDTFVFLPAGIGLVAMLAWGYGVAIAIALGTFLLELEWTGLSSLVPATEISLISVLQTVVGTYLIRRYVKSPFTLIKTGDVLKFLFLGGPVSIAVGAISRGLNLYVEGTGSTKEILYLTWNWWISYTTGVLVFSPLLLLKFGTPKPLWKKRRLLVGLPLCFAFVSFVIVVYESRSYEKKNLRLAFEQAASDRASQIQKQFESYLHGLYALANTMTISKTEDGKDFRESAKTWFALYPGIYDFSYSARIALHERKNFEKKMRALGFIDYSIRELGPDGTVRVAGERPEYYATQFVEPYRKDENILGFDSNSNSSRRQTLEQARDSGRATTSSPLKLILKVSKRVGTMVLCPVYHGNHDTLEERRKNIRGFIKVTFSLSDVVHVSNRGNSESPLKLALYDYALMSEPVYSEIPKVPFVNSTEDEESVSPLKTSWETALDLADRKFLLKVIPNPAYWNGKVEGGDWFLLSSGVIMLGLLVAFLLTNSGASYTNAEQLAERTRISEQLKQTAKELERSNSDLEQFAYLASHDLQEPLRTISSHLQLLKKASKDKLDKESRDFVDFAVDGARRMSALIHDLLEYSKVSRMDVLKTTVSTKSLVDKALENLRATLREVDAEITIGDLPTLDFNPTDGIMLFQNLIGNAVKYRSENRKPKVKIWAEKRQGYYQFSVSDNGIGIAEENRERIFLLFQRLHGLGQYSGTGIGLALCKKIVDRHGGDIWVDSKVNEGSVFYFTLPV